MAHDDSAWKDILDTHFEAFLAFFFPEIHRDIDWSRGYEALDKQLQVILRGSRSPRRLVDKLVKVRLRSGRPVVILLHVEVQRRPEANFDHRMYQYNYRIFDRYGGDVISLAILTDSRSRRGRNCYSRRRWGFELLMRYPVVHLLDYEGRERDLEVSKNSFAVVVLAHLDARRTSGDPFAAFEAKRRLTRRLYERGHSKRDIMGVYKFIDWVLRLPDDLEKKLLDHVTALERRKAMPYITYAERHGMKRGEAIGEAKGEARGEAKGEAKGPREGIALALRHRFGREGTALLTRIRRIDDLKALKALLRVALEAHALDAVRRKLPRG